MPDQNEEKSLDVSARTVDEAVEQGLAQLGLSRDQVDIEIITEGKRGVFGLGSEEAQIRLTPKSQRPVESPQEADVPSPEPTADTPAAQTAAPKPDTVSAPAQPSEQDTSAEETTESEQEEDVPQLAKRFLSDLLRLMGVEAEIVIREDSDLVEDGERPIPVLDITGKDLGILIGRRSETLRALQYMVRLMVSKQMRSWQPIIVDVESYRVRRRRSLRQMAETMAERAVTTRKKVVLEAMPAYERRIVHITLKDHPKVFTKSVGSDDNRKVTIIPK